MTLLLNGSGQATLVYGNPWATGETVVYLNNQQIDQAGSQTPLKTKVFNFTSGDLIKIREESNGVIAISSLTFVCRASPATVAAPEPAPAPAPAPSTQQPSLISLNITVSTSISSVICPAGHQCRLKCIGPGACSALQASTGWFSEIICDGATACYAARIPDCPPGKQCELKCINGGCKNLKQASGHFRQVLCDSQAGTLSCQNATAPACQIDKNIALLSNGALAVSSNSNDPWRPGTNNANDILKGTNVWGRGSGVHVQGPPGWLDISLGGTSTIRRIVVKQPIGYVSQNFKLEAIPKSDFSQSSSSCSTLGWSVDSPQAARNRNICAASVCNAASGRCCLEKAKVSSVVGTVPTDAMDGLGTYEEAGAACRALGELYELLAPPGNRWNRWEALYTG